MNSNSLIHLESIKKVFFTDEVETHALAEIHLTIGKGEYVSIAGPSGCGKSTLLAILGLLDTATDRVVSSVEAGPRPWGVALSADGTTLYTANGPSNDVTATPSMCVMTSFGPAR